MKRWIEGHWYFSVERLVMCYVVSGEYEEGEKPRIGMEIESNRLPGLFQAAMEAGILPLTLERNSRGEDLKIIHRVLDIMDKFNLLRG